MRKIPVPLALSVVTGYYWFGRFLFAEASSAAGTETLVGIVGKDFVLLGADSSVSQSISLTASNLDKIAPLVDPFPEVYQDTTRGNEESRNPHRLLQRQWQRRKRQQAIIAAAAGDAADSDRLLSYLKAIGSVEEYTNGGLGCDVGWVSLEDREGDGENDNYSDAAKLGTCSSRSRSKLLNNGGGLDVRSMAHLARRCIWEKMRSRTPYRICLLIAGMMLEDEFPSSCDVQVDVGVGVGGRHGDTDIGGESMNKNKAADRKPKATENGAAFTSQKVQKQVQQAWKISADNKSGTTSTKQEDASSSSTSSIVTPYRPRLYWLDEYGSLQKIQYGAHGHGSNFLLSILDQSYRPDLTREEAIQLMNECFQELRNRYVINSPEAPCIKCVDAHGIRWVPPSTSSEKAQVQP